jgi:hypothetical protein
MRSGIGSAKGHAAGRLGEDGRLACRAETPRSRIALLRQSLASAASLPVSASHSRAVLSADAVTTRLPSGLKAALHTRFVWPLRTAASLPVSASHSRACRQTLSPRACHRG